MPKNINNNYLEISPHIKSILKYSMYITYSSFEKYKSFAKKMFAIPLECYFSYSLTNIFKKKNLLVLKDIVFFDDNVIYLIQNLSPNHIKELESFLERIVRRNADIELSPISPKKRYYLLLHSFIRRHRIKFLQQQLSTRLINILINAGIETIGELVKYSEDDLQRLDKFCQNSLKEIKTFLLKNHLKLSDNSLGKPRAILLQPLSTLDLSTRASNSLGNEGIETIGELVKYSEDDLLGLDKFGKNSLKEIKKKLKKIGFELSNPNDKISEENNSLNSRDISDIKLLAPNSQEIKKSILGIKFSAQKLSARLINSLANVGIFTVQDILSYSEEKLISIDKFGAKCLDEIKGFLLKHDVKLSVPFIIIEDKTSEENNSPIYFKDYVQSRYDEKTAEIIISNFSGETLESIGKKYKLSRERIRQICNKLKLKKIDCFLKEDKFKEVFLKYKWDKDAFCKVMDENILTYKYLLKRYGIGTKKLESILQDNSFTNQQKTIYAKSQRMILNDEGEVLYKENFLNMIVKKYAMNEITLKELTQKYNQDIEKYPELKLKQLEEKNLEARFNLCNYTCSGIHHTIRYYDLTSISKKNLIQALPINRGFYSTEYLFYNNINLMRELDIRNKYELHSILRFHIHNQNIKFLRMPNLLIKCTNKEKFVLEKIREYSPISIKELANILKIDYGHDECTIVAYLFEKFSKYLINNLLNVKARGLSEKQINNLKPYLTEDIYLINELEEITNKMNYNIKEVANRYICYQLGYRLESNFLISQRFSSVSNYLEYIIQKQDIIKFNDEYIKLASFYMAINAYLREFKLFKLDEGNVYITKKKLESLNIKEVDLHNLVDVIKKSFANKNFFSVYNVMDVIDYSKFEAQGLSETFLENILVTIENLNSMRIANNKLFSFKSEKININYFILYVINIYSKITLTSLKGEILKLYKIEISEENLRKFLYNMADIFYSDILDKVYIDKKDFYQEVFNG